MADAPHCRTCGSAHWSTQPHVWKKGEKPDSDVVLAKKVFEAFKKLPPSGPWPKPLPVEQVKPEPVKRPVKAAAGSKARSGDRHKMTEDRKAYKLEWQKKRRADKTAWARMDRKRKDNKTN